MRNRISTAVGALALTLAAASVCAQTSGTIPKYATSNTFTNSVVVENSGQIGVGGTPTQKLDVFGSIRGNTNLYLTGATWGNGLLVDDGAGATLFTLTRQSGGVNGNTARFLSLGDVSFASGTGATEIVRFTGGGYAQFTRSGKLMYVNPNYSGQNQWGYLGMKDGDGMGLSLSSSDQHPEYLFVKANGKIGIGTTAPSDGFALHLLRADNPNAPESFAVQSSNGGTNSYADGQYLADKAAFSVRAYGSAFNTFSHVPGLSLANMSEIWADQIVAESNAGLLIGTGSRSTAPLPPIIFATQSTERMRISGDGNVTIKAPTSGYSLDVTGTVHASGDITSSGSIYANYQDLAEWVAASEPLAPGTVVILNPDQRDEVTASTNAYDTSVAGVVSERPGIVLGKAAANKAQIATTGRVKVKVDATREPIKIGDLLVTSNGSGTAMKSIPVNVAGVSMHRPGTIIGKALEPLNSGTGEILVLLSLQ